MSWFIGIATFFVFAYLMADKEKIAEERKRINRWAMPMAIIMVPLALLILLPPFFD